MPQGKVDFNDLAIDLATRPGHPGPEYGLAPYNPTASPPTAQAVPDGARVVTIQRDGAGRIVQKVTVDSPTPALGGFVLPAMILAGVLGWVAHAFKRPRPGAALRT